MNNAVFLIQCADRKGLVSEITGFFFNRGFNIVNCQQHTDSYCQRYFMRLKLDLAGIKITKKDLEKEFAKFAEVNNLQWTVNYSDVTKRVALLVTKESHCLYDIIIRWREGEFRCEIPLIISNHPDLEYVANQFKIPFFCVPVLGNNKEAQEAEIIKLTTKHHIDLLVLAKYMRILSADFVSRYPNRIINIHHAFLPAFQGANPYRQAYERGVKMIGATAHYVTAQLDEGPIIEQDVERVDHEKDVDELRQIGRDIERVVLARAIKAELENRIIVFNGRTIVFS